jgi:hypothetical protein
MNLVRVLFILILSLSFSGCAFIYSLDSNLPAKIDEWAKQEEYGKALNVLEHIRPNNENYALLMKKKQVIERQAKNFEQKTILTANQLVSKNQWHKASLLYEDATDKLPDSEKLEESYSDFKKKREAYLEDLETQLLIYKGVWLNNTSLLYNKIKVADPDKYRSVNGIKDYEADRDKTLESLVECARTASAADQLALAGKCLALAQRMDSALKKDPRLDEVRNKLNQARDARTRQYKRQTSALIAQLRQGYSQDVLQRAHDHLQAADQFEPLDDANLKLLEDLNKRLQSGIHQRMESARRLYSRGKIEQALQIWESLQSLAPGNQQLQAYIERARRVLEKLQRLQKEGPAVTPPNGTS